MADELVVAKVDLKPGDAIKIKGVIKSDAKGFSVNVGADDDNLVLHFNPRFDLHGDIRTIVCNSRQDGVWGDEQRDTMFPFEQGEEVKVSVALKDDYFEIKLPEDQEITFPYRMPTEKINLLSVHGDIKVNSFKID